MTATDALRRARKGAKFLDRKVPGWARKVRLTKLDMSEGFYDGSGCGCVVAQLNPGVGFCAGLDALGVAWFNSEDDELGFDDENGDYGDLTEAWRSVIRERRAKAKS